MAGTLSPFLDGERTISLCQEVMKPNIRRRDEALFTPLSAQIYVVGHYFPGSARCAVFAVYNDDTLLWLDDHSNNRDFDVFWQREKFQWQNADDLAHFMMLTKFHYLGLPSLTVILNTIADVPQAKWRKLILKMKEDGYLKDLFDFEQKLADLAPRLYRTSLKVDQRGLELRFCVWLMVAGQVFDITCRFEPNGTLSYHGKELAVWVGQADMPK